MEQRGAGFSFAMNRMAELHSILRGVELVLLDFDGPLCDVFAGYPAPEVARELEKIAGESFSTDDPLEVLRAAALRDNRALRIVEDELIAAEVRAVSSSSPIAAGVEFLKFCVSHGLHVGVVSNNSDAAVLAFLDAHDLTGIVAPVVGRATRHPELMKPNTWPMRTALQLADKQARAAVYVGDSLSDIEVAQAMSMPCVAYANKPGKRQLFENHGGAVVVDSMSELSAAMAAAQR